MSPYGLFALSNPCVSRDTSSLMIYASLGLVALSNPCLTHDTISLKIYESKGAVCAVESLRRPCQQFVDYL